jgi:hypothetical protein
MRFLRRIVPVFLVASATMLAQTTSGSITGSVVDPQGAPVVGATVNIQNMDTNAVVTTTTRVTGDFIAPNLSAAPYRITVEQTGFKKFVKTNLVLNANTDISVGRIQLDIGAMEQSVEVVAQGASLKTETAEQSTSVVGTQIANTEVNGRTFLGLLRVVPGMYADGDFSVSNNQTGNIYVNGSRGDTFNLTINGASNIDTGSNSKMMATVSLDSVQEFTVLTSNFDAQYGKNSGAQVMVVTKSGSNAFHGSGYWYYRDRGLNANSWQNNRDSTPTSPLPRSPYHFNYEGYTIGGPVYIPGKFTRLKDKLFFFWSEEYQQQLIPQTSPVNVTVPTALERKGDFSLSHDSSGNAVVIKDYQNGNAPFPGNVIPQARLYAPGQALLNFYPLPNVTGQNSYNYQSEVSGKEPRHEQLLRLDYNYSARWRFTGSLTRLPSDALSSPYCPAGYSLCPNFPIQYDGKNENMVYNHPGYVTSINAITTISPTMINEFLFDVAHHPVTVLPADSAALTRSTTGINLPTLFSPYEDWIPQASFAGTKISNQPNFDTGGGAWTPFKTYNTTVEWSDSVTKTLGSHMVKGGVFFQRNRKNQTAYVATGGNYNFGDSTTNPYDSGFGFSNALMGIYSSFQQGNQPVTGQYRYTNAEFFLQDSWKIHPRLTLNYGVRGYYIQPYYDKGMNASNFLPSTYDPSQAVRLYWPTLDANGAKVGIDRATGQTVSSLLIGDIVPGSGNIADGLIQAGKGISPYLMQSPGIQLAPRFGLAWVPTGKQDIVFRAGGGLYYDRYQGNDVFNMVANPPTVQTPILYNGLAANIGASGNSSYLAPMAINAIDYSGKVPRIINYSAGLQTRLPWAVILDTSYVGSISRHLLETTNINAVPYGSTFLAQNQDPTKVKANPNNILGSNSYDTNFLRPYQGYGDITMYGMGSTSNYNSLAVKADRRFAKGLFLSTAFSWSKCLSTANADGDGFRVDNLTRYHLYGPCSYNVPLNLTVNYVYEIPGARHWGPLNNVFTRGLFDGWQVSGISQFRNGTPKTPSESIPSYGSTQITGSQSLGQAIWLVGNPLTGTTSSPYNRLNAAAFRPSPVGSIGVDSPVYYIVQPGVNNWDMSLQREIPVKEKMAFHFRLDAFNTFNHTQFNGLNTQVNFSSINNNATVTNLPYGATGTSALNKSGFGTVSGVRSPRIMQVTVKFTF